MRRLMRTLLALGMVFGVFVSNTGIAQAQTWGNYNILTLVYAPMAPGMFMGTVDIDCIGGTYEVACRVSNAAVKVTPQMRVYDGSTWSAWTNVISEQTKYCTKAGSFCANNATTLMVQTACNCPAAQYRTRVKTGAVNQNGTWVWNSYKYSQAVLAMQCD